LAHALNHLLFPSRGPQDFSILVVLPQELTKSCGRDHKNNLFLWSRPQENPFSCGRTTRIGEILWSTGGE
jgi:hypothetical protein